MTEKGRDLKALALGEARGNGKYYLTGAHSQGIEVELI